MRPDVRWLLLGALAGRVLLSGGEASAAHQSWEGRDQDAAVEMTPGDLEIDRDRRASEGSGGSEGAGHPVAAWLEHELGHVTHELDDLTVTTLGEAEQLAGRLVQGTRAGATGVHHAYLAVTTTLISLGRCFEEGVAISPFGPAGPRAPDPPSGSAGADDPCDLAGHASDGSDARRHATVTGQPDSNDGGGAADHDEVIGGDIP